MSRQETPRLCVLIVEDHEPQRRNLHEELEFCGFEVWSAGDVASARGYIENLEALDVAVLDSGWLAALWAD